VSKPKLRLIPFGPSVQRALVVVAHPDDIDFSCAGTVAALTSRGVQVSYCLVTSGDAGGDSSTHTKQERAAIREREQTAAAQHVGVHDLYFLGYPDGMVEVTLELRKAISRVIRIVRPDIVITQNPERNWERLYASHPDHMAAGEATLRAIYPDARNPHAFPELVEEGLAPHTVPLTLVSTIDGDGVVDITDTFDQKIAALRCHESQVGERTDLREMLRKNNRAVAKRAGLAKGRLAEAFRVVDTK
jgi:LmbE family N-acetylglucosaminyl deacetylase